MNIYYDKILGRLREAGLTDNSATEIALILSELVESNEATELNTKNVVTALNNVASQLEDVKNLLKLILS